VWREGTVHSFADIRRVLEAVASAMARAGYVEKEQFAVRLALDEALINAHKHGHQGDWSPAIAVRFSVRSEGVMIAVEDQGPGFNPEEVPDPRAPENLERPSGRGLLLMRLYMTRVWHNARGNCVHLCKDRARASPCP
jgi:serine/threonine-protein kinase RsbW